jgi:hypothetical protein
LIRTGEIGGRPAIAMPHLTGARVNVADRRNLIRDNVLASVPDDVAS